MEATVVWKSLLLSLLIICFFICSCLKSYSQCFPVDTTRLNTAYRELIEDRNSIEKQKSFLDAFPSSFDDFFKTYQFCPAKGYDLSMYSKGSDHILNGLATLNLIPDSTYCDKLIRLSFGGRFYVDAPNHLKMLLRRVIKEKQEIFLQRLSNFSQAQLISFWFFYFHSRFEKDYVSEFENFKKFRVTYPNVISAMEIAYPAACGKVWY
jgi:hypothetical protein